MKESTFLPEWDILYPFVVVEQNEKSFCLKCCCESVFSSVNRSSQIIALFTHVKEHAHSEHSQCNDSLHGHKFWAAGKTLKI